MAIKKLALLLWVVSLAISGLAHAHHASQGIVDDEVYEMIDALVADTPHGDMTTVDLGTGMATTITTMTAVEMENLIEDGIISYAGMLDGDVSIEIVFGPNQTVTMTILQQE